MTIRRVSLLVGLLCLVASMSVAGAPPTPKLDGKISGVEFPCWQAVCGFATFAGTFNGKVIGEHTTGHVAALVTHGDLPTKPGDTAIINEGGYWLIWTSLGNFEGTVGEGSTLSATKNVNRFDVTVNLQMNGLTGKFVGVLDHSGLAKQPPEPPTFMGDVFSCDVPKVC